MAPALLVAAEMGSSGNSEASLPFAAETAAKSASSKVRHRRRSWLIACSIFQTILRGF